MRSMVRQLSGSKIRYTAEDREKYILNSVEKACSHNIMFCNMSREAGVPP